MSRGDRILAVGGSHHRTCECGECSYRRKHPQLRDASTEAVTSTRDSVANLEAVDRQWSPAHHARRAA